MARDSYPNECPICCTTNFKTTDELAQHIDEHFNPKGKLNWNYCLINEIVLT